MAEPGFWETKGESQKILKERTSLLERYIPLAAGAKGIGGDGDPPRVD